MRNLSLFSLLCLTALTSCYRMPTADDYSVIPMTNNRDFNKEGDSPLLPTGMGLAE